MARSKLYGVMAEFETPEQILHAAQQARAEGYRRMDGYSPFPVEGLAEAVGFEKTRLSWIVICGGLTGCCGGFFLQWWPNVIGYPLDIGGKPYNSWPSFIPITFELTILFSALSAVFGMIALNGLPQPYHPVFNAPQFDLASRDRFFLCIEARDPKFDLQLTKEFLASLDPVDVTEVES
jgi:Alternative complex III, ActD subunit